MNGENHKTHRCPFCHRWWRCLALGCNFPIPLVCMRPGCVALAARGYAQSQAARIHGPDLQLVLFNMPCAPDGGSGLPREDRGQWRVGMIPGEMRRGAMKI